MASSSSAMSTNSGSDLDQIGTDPGRSLLAAKRKIQHGIPPPSMCSSSVASGSGNRKLIPPPPPSIGTGSSVSGSGDGRSSVGSKRSGSDRSKSNRQVKKSRQSGSSYAMSESSDDEPDISPELRRQLEIEQRRIFWINHSRTEWKLTYDSLVLGRKIDYLQSDQYVDTTYCRAELLKQLMDIKYDIRDIDEDKFFELRTSMSSYGNMEGIIFHNGDAIKMANIDAMMGYQLSNPRTFRGETLLKNGELLYFVDVCGGPGGSAEYFLWKKQWHAHGFGFTSKSMDWDLPVKAHYSAESFDAHYGFYGRRGQGDIYNTEEVDAFIKYVRRETQFEGAHICLAEGGDTGAGDEDKKELRCKYLLLSQFLIALNVLREGGHFVCKIYDMFTSFTVGLVYLMYRCFDSVAIYKPETGLMASSERYILCKYRRQNRFILEVCRYLMDTLKIYQNTQRLAKGFHDEVADVVELVPFEAIREANYFYDHIIRTNRELGFLQLKQTRELQRYIRDNSFYVKARLEEVRKKALSLWGIPETFKLNAKYTDAATPGLRAMKLVRPYPADILESIERDGEQILSFGNIELELKSPKEWRFVPVGRDRGFFLSLGGQDVYRYTGSGSNWEKLVEKVDLCNNTLVYADIVDEVKMFDNTQVIKIGFHIIDALLLGGKDIRALPYVERWELCAKFAQSMNKPIRDDLASVRVKTQHSLNEIPSCLNMIKKKRLLGGGRGPSKEAIYPIEEAIRATKYQGKQLIFKPTGFCIFKSSKGGAVEGDFLYCLQNRMYWRFTEDVNLDPQFGEWQEDAKQKYGPIHAATLIDYLKRAMRNQQ